MDGTLRRLDDDAGSSDSNESSGTRSRRSGGRSPSRPTWRHGFRPRIEGEREQGSVLRFSFPNGEAPPFDGEMLAYEPPRLMEFRWGVDIIRIELVPPGTADHVDPDRHPRRAGEGGP